ncbi:MAG: hypothetical protein ACREJ9_15495 [Candidatus Rokuibacteriota bacterium]
MTARRRAAGVALVAALALSGPIGAALGNGDTQREVQGRVVSVDMQARTLVVDREFRGKTTRVTLRTGPGLTVFACGGESATLDRVKTGTLVSVFYEVLGTEGVANLVVVEPGR